MNWETYTDYRAGEVHTVNGDVRVLRNVHSPQLNNTRDILVYLPPSYNQSDKRYPVIYMQDGQNAFDAATSFAGEWHIDEAIETLAENHIEAIVVALPNTGNYRMVEYNPFHHTRFGKGRGAEYINFIAYTVKPLVDSHLRTKPERPYTGLLGSSMGGLISLYGFFYKPQIFGFVGSMSPSIWLGNDQLTRTIQEIAQINGRIYLDIGEQELAQENADKSKTGKAKNDRSLRYADNVSRLGEEIASRLKNRDDYKFVRDTHGTHSEDSWSRRLPDALNFLLSGL